MLTIDGNVRQGSRPRCLCRFFCCTVFILLFIIAAIVLALTLVRYLVVPLNFFSLLFPFQWIRPPNIIVGSGVNGTVSLHCTQGNKSNIGTSSVASCCPGRQPLERRVPNKYGHPYRVCTLTLRI